ncbi:MAG: hypothetical protein ACR2PG_22065 [Hyphomicrobiaceae bacterium]
MWLSPPQVVEALAEYRERMFEIIFAFDGTVDKCISAGIMVTFGTLDPSNVDAER